MIYMTQLGYSGCDQRYFCCYLRPFIIIQRLFAGDPPSAAIETVQQTGISAISSTSNYSNSPVRLSDPNSGSNLSSKSGSGNKNNNNDDVDNNQKDLTLQISACDSHIDLDGKESLYDDRAPPTQRHDSVWKTIQKGILEHEHKHQ